MGALEDLQATYGCELLVSPYDRYELSFEQQLMTISSSQFVESGGDNLAGE